MGYLETATEKLEKLRKNGGLVLAIESSCDETAAAVTRGRAVLSNVIHSQIEIHRRFGGVVPEIASRNHTLAVEETVCEALAEAGVTLADIDAVAVTYGAGLLGALLVGVCYAKGLAYAKNLPLIAVSHIKGHIAANYIAHPALKPPFLCLLASGGHTEILKIKSFAAAEVLGKTRDDAAGEAFDKVARVLSLPYPGGPEIERLAKEGDISGYPMPRPFKGEKHLDFSFSGIKTAVVNLAANAKQKGEAVRKADLAASFQHAAAAVLVENTLTAAKRTRIKTVALAGGVGANGYLRTLLAEEGAKNGLTVLLPPKSLCTDNAAMIGVAAYEEILCGAEAARLTLDADPAL